MRKAVSAALAAMLCLLCACGAPTAGTPGTGSGESLAAPEAPADPRVPETPEEVEEPELPDPVQLLLDSLSLEEKVGQLFFVRCPGSGAVEDVKTYHLGGYILFGRDTKDQTAENLSRTIASYQEAAGEKIPLLIGVDEEGGTVVRVSSNPRLRASKFPEPRVLWQQGPEAVTADTREKDQLLSSLGFNVNLAPVADVSTDPGDFIYRRTTGKDAAEASSYVASVVETMREDGMGAVLKHFPGYGNNVDTHTGIALDQRPMETFCASDFLPFQAGFAAGGELAAVLVNHNIVSAMDPELPASLSPAVHRVLREDLGFDGVVMTDDLAMDAVEAYAEDGAVAVMALQAGNDLVLTTDYWTQIPKVLEGVQAGTLDETLIDAACYRVLRWKAALGLLELPKV